MATIKIKKGYNLNLKGEIANTSVVTDAPAAKEYVIVPDDFTGLIPRLDKKEGESVLAGEALFHDKNLEAVKVTSPVSGVVKEVRRGERRKIEAIVIAADGKNEQVKFDIKSDPATLLGESGLMALVRQRPYDIVPDPAVAPRDIFVTCFDSAPLAAPTAAMLDGRDAYLETAVKVLSKLTSGKVYLGCAPDAVIEVPGAVTNVFDGPHPAGLAGVQVANVAPVNKGEVVWTMDVVTLARIGKLFTEGVVDYSTVVAVTGQEVKEPKLVRCIIGAPIESLVGGNIAEGDDKRIVSGNVLTGIAVGMADSLRAPYRQITVIRNVGNADEFMGWASLSPKKFSIYHTFLHWLCGGNKPVSVDSRLNGGERAIVVAGEYDRMFPMDIYAEFLLKAIIAFEIEKMEQLGIYEVAPEDFALAEFADTSKLPLQEIVRNGLDRLRAEMS